MFIFFMTLLGVCLGSFFYVIAYRLSRNESWVSGRSRCDNCSHKLSWYDLIPLLSFVLLRGRCRYCKEKIDNNHIAMELLMGVGFLVIAAAPLPLFEKIIAFAVCMVLGFNSASDMAEHMTHTVVIYGGMLIIIALRLFSTTGFTWQGAGFEILLNVMFAVMCILLCIIASKYIGAGDMNIMMLLFLCCKPYALILFSGTLISSLHLMLVDRKPQEGEMVAFVPYIFIGYLINIFVGGFIV